MSAPYSSKTRYNLVILTRHSSWLETHTPISPFEYEYESEKQQMVSQAAERALFMTPSAHQFSLSTFPGSPLSDPCGTPEMTYTSSSRWEADQDGDDVQSLPWSDISSSSQAMAADNWSSGNCAWKQDEDCMDTLEMPDGSTRKTSNWLPVDPKAGFTIGSSSSQNQPRLDTSMHADGLFNIQEALLSPDSARWTYHG